MAIDTSGNIRIIFINQGFAVDALRILIVDGRVTFRAGFRDFGPRVTGRGDIMSAMTVGTDSRIPVAGGNLPSVDTVQRLIVDIFMTILANLVMLQLVKAAVVGFHGGVRITGNILMTISTEDPLAPVNRVLIGFRVYMDRPNLARGELVS